MKKTPLHISQLLIIVSCLWGFTPTTKAELQSAVDFWVSNNASALSTYGEINTWDVSLVTDMRDLFKNKANFNDDINLAKKLIKCAKQSNANAVKLQTYTADTMTIKSNKKYLYRKI